MTSRGKRNPAKLDLGGGTRRWRRPINSACPSTSSAKRNRPWTGTSGSHFAAELRRLRDQAGLSFGELARRAHVNRGYVQF
ncbi:MAG: helix-turn-helix domain-containing protein [Pseudonocardiaceae bacterium]